MPISNSAGSSATSLSSVPSDNPFRNINFRWLFGGAAISMFGDQFTLIALPWLVLQLTDDPFALASTVAAIMIPRAMLILFGGALVDRHSPKLMLLLAKIVSALTLTLLSLLEIRGVVDMRCIYTLSILLGMVSALGMPASAALLPRIIEEQRLAGANRLLMGLNQAAALIGPMAAGFLIARYDHRANGELHPLGLGIALLIDGVSFFISAWTLSKITISNNTVATGLVVKPLRLLHEVQVAFVYLWADSRLRACCLYWIAIAFCIGGPMQVALPILANTRLNADAAALGILVASHSAGSLIGMLFANIGFKWRKINLGAKILLIDALIGALLVPVGFLSVVWLAAIFLFLIGACGGYIQIGIYTWVQRKIAPELLGRAMSLFMFLIMVFTPISVVLTGCLLRVFAVSYVFLAIGFLLICIALAAHMLTDIAKINDMEPS